MKKILHLEAFLFFVLVVSLYFYHFQFTFLWFLILILVPDLSALGYLISSRVGSVTYNFFHTYVISVVFMVFGYWIDNRLVLMVSLIWTAHIAMDRMLGYGLKKKHTKHKTHMQCVVED